MRKVILFGLMAATVLPGMAAAQTRELARDRQEIREERRDLREAKREYRQDWREYRREHRNVYARGDWRSPYRYRSFGPGVRIEQRYYAPRYVIGDPWRYRLPAAHGPLRWVRHYDDVLLVNMRTGRVVEVHRNFFW